MERRIVRDEQPTLDELLDEPIVRLLMASDGVNRSEVEAVIANLRSMRPEGAPRTRRRKHDGPIPAASSLPRLPAHCVAPQPGFRAR